MPFARVRVSIARVSREITADEEGFYQALIRLDEPLLLDRDRPPVIIELIEPQPPGHPPMKVEAPLSIFLPGCQFGVISDIDDTVVRTDVANPFNILWTILLGNAYTRRTFPGTPAFYRGLAHFTGDDAPNPILYLS